MPAPRDIDLMRLADGELDADERAELEAALAADPDARQKLAALSEIGELVRTDLELAADRADPRLARMWGEIEKQIGREIDKQIDLPAPSRARSRVRAPAAAPTDRVGPWARITRWIDTYRGHVLTGALSAGAVAAVALLIRPAPKVAAPPPRVVEMPPAPIAANPPPQAGPIVPVHQPAAIESVDVPHGTSTVFTIKGDDGDETTVIWVTPDDTVKGIQ